MSEEKLYAVKNDEGKYWDFDTSGFCVPHISGCLTTHSKKQAEIVADEQGGHVVTFVEEPYKEVLSEEQAKIVEKALTANFRFPDTFISDKSDPDNDDQGVLMNAYVNGYTVAKEKKYKVRVPETQTSYYYKGSDGHVHASDTSGGLDNEFSDYELQQYGLDGERFTKEEVTDDGMGC